MSSGGYACSVCAEVYDFVDDFKCHIMKKHMRWFPFECNICKDFMAVSKIEIYMHLASVHEEQVVTYTSNGAMETELNRQIEMGCVKETQEKDLSNYSSGIATALTATNTNSPASSRNSADYNRNWREESVSPTDIDDFGIETSSLHISPDHHLSNKANDSTEIVFESPNTTHDASSCMAALDTSGSKIIVFIGLNSPKFNCDAIFNLCCLYGDVIQVQFVNKNKCAVEMREESGADNCIHFLNNLQVFDSSVSIMKSPLKNLLENKRFVLEDGTDSCKTFERSPFNRFGPGYAGRNRLSLPNRGLFMWNMPSDMTGVRFMQELKKFGVTTQTNAKFYRDKNTQMQVGRGVLFFGTIKHATEAMMLINNKMNFDTRKLVKENLKPDYKRMILFDCIDNVVRLNFDNVLPKTQSHLAGPPIAQVERR